MQMPLLRIGLLVFCLTIVLLIVCPWCDTEGLFGLVDVDATEPGKVCEVHNIPLQEDVVSITYGLPRRPRPEEMEAFQKEIEASQKLFPNARSSYQDGGCVVKAAKWARVSFCPECRRAEAVWEEEQKRIMEPIIALRERIYEVIRDNPKYDNVYPFIRRVIPPSVGIEGHVKSAPDLVELKRLVEATAPPQPVHWSVRVDP